MRAIAAILLMLTVTGCGKNGPTPEQVEAKYQAAIKELKAMEGRLAETKLDLEQHSEMDQQIIDAHKQSKKVNYTKEDEEELEAIHGRMMKNRATEKQLIKEQIEHITGMIAMQKKLVEDIEKQRASSK